jgi:hypothetical protein
LARDPFYVIHCYRILCQIKVNNIVFTTVMPSFFKKINKKNLKKKKKEKLPAGIVV